APPAFGARAPPLGAQRGPSRRLDAAGADGQRLLHQFHARLGGVEPMIIPERPSLERRVLNALEPSTGAPACIPVVLGGCGTGRTSLLLRVRALIGRSSCQYIDVERIATTPEQSLASIRTHSPLPPGHAGSVT